MFISKTAGQNWIFLENYARTNLSLENVATSFEVYWCGLQNIAWIDRLTMMMTIKWLFIIHTRVQSRSNGNISSKLSTQWNYKPTSPTNRDQYQPKPIAYIRNAQFWSLLVDDRIESRIVWLRSTDICLFNCHSLLRPWKQSFKNHV